MQRHLREARYEEWRATKARNAIINNMTPSERMRTFCTGLSKVCVKPKVHVQKLGLPWYWDLTLEQRPVAIQRLAELITKWKKLKYKNKLPVWLYGALVAQAKSWARHGRLFQHGSHTTWHQRYAILRRFDNGEVLLRHKPKPVIKPLKTKSGTVNLEGI